MRASTIQAALPQRAARVETPWGLRFNEIRSRASSNMIKPLKGIQVSTSTPSLSRLAPTGQRRVARVLVPKRDELGTHGIGDNPKPRDPLHRMQISLCQTMIPSGPRLLWIHHRLRPGAARQSKVLFCCFENPSIFCPTLPNFPNGRPVVLAGGSRAGESHP